LFTRLLILTRCTTSQLFSKLYLLLIIDNYSMLAKYADHEEKRLLTEKIYNIS